MAIRRVGAPVRGVGSALRAEHTREGLWLRLSDGVRVGHGEASPLPGFSSDSFAEAGTVLSALDSDELGRWLDSSDDAPALLQRTSRLGSSPAAQHAVEGALLDLLGQRLGRPLSSLWGVEPRPAGLPAVLLRADDATASLAVRAVAAGAAALKVKIGRPGAFAAELAALWAIREAVGDVELRLDANRAFADDVVGGRLAELAKLRPCFVEEPFRSGLRGRQLDAEPVPIAIDESLVGASDAEIDALFGARPAAVIVKPMALGLGAAWRLCQRTTGLRTVVTHLWDGPIALETARTLGRIVPTPTGAPGLAPHPGLEAWPAMRFSDGAAGLGLELA